MAKVLRCRDVGLACEGELRADTEEETLPIGESSAGLPEG
jgi:predicted small metal-binding protein